METREIERIKHELTECLNMLAQQSNQTRGQWASQPDNISDIIDQANLQLEMEFAFGRLLRAGLNKGRILSALQKIEDGSYGICEMCEEKIPRRRLKAIPDAVHCLHCQTQLERAEACG